MITNNYKQQEIGIKVNHNITAWGVHLIELIEILCCIPPLLLFEMELFGGLWLNLRFPSFLK